MIKVSKIVQEMRLHDDSGERLYLNKDERYRFLEASKGLVRENRAFCTVLHYTGCRPSEALALTPKSIEIYEQSIKLRTLKKRKLDNQGRLKRPQYRAIPVPEHVIHQLEFVFDLQRINQSKMHTDTPLWSMCRATAWRLVKFVMAEAGIEGKQATSKGLRHGFGIAMLSGERPAPIHIVRDLLGHSDTSTTEIYLQALDEEKRKMVMQAWE